MSATFLSLFSIFLPKKMEVMSTHRVMTIKGRNELIIPSTEPESVLLLKDKNKIKIHLKYQSLTMTCFNDGSIFHLLAFNFIFPSFYVEHICSTTVRNK